MKNIIRIIAQKPSELTCDFEERLQNVLDKIKSTSINITFTSASDGKQTANILYTSNEKE